MEVGGSVLLETSWGDIAVDLYTKECPKACENFLKLCKIKYYNGCLFHRIERDFAAQCGDADGRGGSSIWGVLQSAPPGSRGRYFEDELQPQKRKRRRLLHNRRGLLSMANAGQEDTNASQFLIQLADRHLDFLDGKHTIFGEVAEGWHVLDRMNNAQVSETHRPMKRISIHHTYVLEDPFPDPTGLGALLPERSPSPSINSAEEDYVSSATDSEEVDEGALRELLAAREARSRELVLEMVGDIADADMDPPRNVLFVCNLNPVTEDEDLEMIFSRFGRIDSCEVIRARDGKSLQYAFIEFREVKACEQAYLKMENVRIDDRRVHVDFSQSVPRIWSGWMQSIAGRSGLKVGGVAWKEGKKPQVPFTWKGERQQQQGTAEEESGVVTKWVGDKGFGFVRRAKGGDLFVHRSAIHEGDALVVGRRVSFTAAVDATSGRARALRVHGEGVSAGEEQAPAPSPQLSGAKRSGGPFESSSEDEGDPGALRRAAAAERRERKTAKKERKAEKKERKRARKEAADG